MGSRSGTLVTIGAQRSTMSHGQPGEIAFFSHSSNVAGAERALVVAVEHVRRSGHDVAVYLPGDGPLARELERLEVPWERYEFVQQFTPMPAHLLPDSWRRIWPGFVERVASIRSTLERRRTRLVYVNTVYPVEAALAAAHLELPVVWHPHELFHERFHDWLLGTPLFAVFMGALSDAVISVAAICKEALAPYVPDEKLHLIHEPVDWAALQEPRAVPEDLRAEREEASFVLVCVGSIDPRKAQSDLLEALTRIPAERLAGLRTWIVGTPPDPDLEREFLAHLGRLPAHVRVRWLGQRSDVPAILQAADVLVHPSINDPFPLIVLEALASGTPVVAARGGGVVEIVADGLTGRLVPCSDPAALAAALVDVLGDSNRLHAMGEAGRAAVRRYDVQVYREKISSVLERCLAADVGRAPRRRLVERFEGGASSLGDLAAGYEELRLASAQVERLRQTRTYRLADAIASSHGLRDALRLPSRLLQIALESRKGAEPRRT
jgi:glycosyltransferase involved in cell wall biosynthesis